MQNLFNKASFLNKFNLREEELKELFDNGTIEGVGIAGVMMIKVHKFPEKKTKVKKSKNKYYPNVISNESKTKQ